MEEYVGMIKIQFRNSYLGEERKKYGKIKEYRGVYILTISATFILPNKKKNRAKPAKY